MARELAAALGRLFPGREIPARWTDAALVGLRDEVEAAPASEHKIRTGRILESLVTARIRVYARSAIIARCC